MRESNLKEKAAALPQLANSKLRNMMLGFQWSEPFWVGRPDMPFKPYGLKIWGAPDGAMVRQCMIGRTEEILVSGEPIPVEWFATGHSYEDLVKLVEDGSALGSWVDFDRMQVGDWMRICLTLNGKTLDPSNVRMTVWGAAQVA